MCRRIDCPSCGRPTFKGCGAHVEQVLGDVPQPDRCRCREDAKERGARGRSVSGTWLDSMRKFVGE